MSPTAPRVWFNPDLKSRNYFVPGVICNLIMVVTVMLTAMAIVREKEIGTMEQLMVTPIRPMELMIGKMVPAALVGMMDLVLMTTAALLIFSIPFRGNPLVLVFSAALFLLTSLGMGLFISTIASTQQQAIMSSSLIAIPTFMLSGFAYPIRNMPIAVQYFTYLNPLRYLIEIVRGIFLKGTGISVLWPQMLTLLVYGMIVMGLSASSFQEEVGLSENGVYMTFPEQYRAESAESHRVHRPDQGESGHRMVSGVPGHRPAYIRLRQWRQRLHRFALRLRYREGLQLQSRHAISHHGADRPASHHHGLRQRCGLRRDIRRAAQELRPAGRSIHGDQRFG